MQKVSVLTACLLAVGMVWGQNARCQDAVLDELAIRKLIIQVIKENPKLVYDTVNQYVRQKKVMERQQEMERGFKNRIQIPISAANPSKGPTDAAITIVEYTDFECAYCARGAAVIDELLALYPDKLKVVFKNNPLSFHKQAVPAAKSALAAYRQGKFWQYHDLLFDNYANLTPELFNTIAGQLELDMQRFNADRNSEKIAAQIASEQAQATGHKFTATPTFVLNGVVVVGAQRLDYFKKVIDRLLAEAAD